MKYKLYLEFYLTKRVESITTEILIQQGGSRLTCPRCGNYTKNMIREEVDKEKLIYDYPPIYGKKYICGSCGSTWRWERED